MDGSTWVRLRSEGGLREDAGGNVIRLDGPTRARLAVEAGDVVEVRARAVHWARVRRAPVVDEGRGVARMDESALLLVGAPPGEWIFVARAEAQPARRLVVAPLDGAELERDTSFSPAGLTGRIVIPGDDLNVGRLQQEGYARGSLALVGVRLATVATAHERSELRAVKIVDTQPLGPVRIDQDTVITAARSTGT